MSCCLFFSFSLLSLGRSCHLIVYSDFCRSRRFLAFHPLPVGYCLVVSAYINLYLKLIPASPDQQISVGGTSAGTNFLYLLHRNHYPFSQATLPCVLYENGLYQELYSIPLTGRDHVWIPGQNNFIPVNFFSFLGQSNFQLPCNKSHHHITDPVNS